MANVGTIIGAVVVLVAIVGVHLIYAVTKSLRTERNDVSISIVDSDVAPTSFSIAVIGDIHLPESSRSLASFRKLLLEVKAANPDLVVFAGDYVKGRSRKDSPFRDDIVNAMKLVDPIPRAAVLGNHETLTNADQWLERFERLGVDVLENQAAILETAKGPICIRGLGDVYTDRFSYIDYPDGCERMPKVTVTHDPAGAFDERVTGLVISGHTHCGQIRLPVIGPLWVPTDAPSGAHCGLYQKEGRSVFTTSGVGTSILSIRYGTQSQWDFLQVAVN